MLSQVYQKYPVIDTTVNSDSYERSSDRKGQEIELDWLCCRNHDHSASTHISDKHRYIWYMGDHWVSLLLDC